MLGVGVELPKRRPPTWPKTSRGTSACSGYVEGLADLLRGVPSAQRPAQKKCPRRAADRSAGAPRHRASTISLFRRRLGGRPIVSHSRRQPHSKANTPEDPATCSFPGRRRRRRHHRAARSRRRSQPSTSPSSSRTSARSSSCSDRESAGDHRRQTHPAGRKGEADPGAGRRSGRRGDRQITARPPTRVSATSTS